MGARDFQVLEGRGRVVRQLAGRIHRLAGQVGLAHPAVVEGHDREVRRERLGLECPVGGGRRQPVDQSTGSPLPPTPKCIRMLLLMMAKAIVAP
jgi:hypothetical protein